MHQGKVNLQLLTDKALAKNRGQALNEESLIQQESRN